MRDLAVPPPVSPVARGGILAKDQKRGYPSFLAASPA